MNKSQNLYNKAKRIIPGGTQLLSKRPEMFAPGQWPTYYQKAHGCEVTDLDGKKYIDMCYMGIGSCTLGYADKDVNNAAKQAIDSGSMSTLNPPHEVELAELLTNLHPWADQVRYTRSGGEAMSVAVRIARAQTNKDIVLFCGYHGWHDWYLSSNISENDELADGHLLPGLNPLGVPKGLKGTAFPFKYNDTDAFLEKIKLYKNNVGAVVIEVIRNMYPDKEFFETIRKVCDKEGIVLIFDEITSGFRLNGAGAHMKFGEEKDCCGYCFEPDIAVFAKAMTNGYPLSAIIGKEKYLSVAQDTFISSLYWTDSIGPAATIASIKKIIKEDVPSYTEKLGKMVQKIWLDSANECGINLKITGPVPQLSIFAFEYTNALEVKTLFNQLMLERGFLTTTAFYASFAHNESHLISYEKAVKEVFMIIKDSIEKNALSKMLNGPICHDGFKRLT